MSNTDFDPQQQAPPPAFFPQPPPSPLTQVAQQPMLQQPMHVATSEPGVNYTGGRMDAQPRDVHTDLPVPATRTPPPPEPTVAEPRVIARPGEPQRFVPNPTVPHQQWRDTPWQIRAMDNFPGMGSTPFMPSYEESFGVARGSTGQLATWGSPIVAGFASIAHGLANIVGPVADFYSGGAFGRGYDSATAKRLGMQREQWEMQREKMLAASEDAVRAQKNELWKYDDILTQFDAHGLTEDQALEEVRKLAIGDQVMQNAIAGGGLKGAETILKQRHAKMVDLWSSTTSQRSHDAQDKAKAKAKDISDSWVKGGGGAAPSGGYDPEHRNLPSGPAEKAAVGSTPVEAPEGVAEPADSPSREFDTKLAKDYDLSPSGVRAAHEIVQNGKPTGMTEGGESKLNPENLARVQAAAGDIGASITNIANGKGTQEEKLDKIKKIEPNIATDVQGLLNYQTDPKSISTKDNNRQHIVRMAEAISNGKYKEDWYDTQKKLNEGPVGRELIRVGQLGDAALVVLDASNKLPLNEPIPMRQIFSQITKKWTGDPKYTNLYHAIQNFAVEVGAIDSGTGTIRVGIFNKLVENMGEAQSPAQIIGGMQVQMQTGQAVIRQATDLWHQQTGTKTAFPPMLNQQGVKDFDAIMHTTKNGEVPPDASARIRAAGRPPNEKTPAWERPIPMSERQKFRDFIAENENSTDPAIQKQVYETIKLLGINP